MIPEPYELFAIKYDGRYANDHAIDAEAFGESIQGAARLYTAIAHYTASGQIPPKGRYRKRFSCYAQATRNGSALREGSVEQFLFLGFAVGNYGLYKPLYDNTAKAVFGMVADAIKRIWTRPSETTKLVERFSAADREQQNTLNAGTVSELTAGLVRANDNLLRAHETANANATAVSLKLIEQLPLLASVTRPQAIRLVAPIGTSCSEITQFADTPFASTITEAEADVIRSSVPMEVEDMRQFTIRQITSLNIKTGHCTLHLDEFGTIPGKITDPVLNVPNNVYTRSLSGHTGVVVNAKAVSRAGVVERLYISNAVPTES